jgi:hypothetical protein
LGVHHLILAVCVEAPTMAYMVTCHLVVNRVLAGLFCSSV